MNQYTGFDINFSLADKVAVVTGGGSGIGNAMVRLFHGKGAKVAILDKKLETPELAKEISEEGVIGVVTDITNKSQIEASLDQIEGTFGKIDILVNSAGVVFLEKAEDLKEADWDLTFEINVKGTFLVAQAVGQRMIKQGGGKIVNMASQAAKVALDQHAAYCASKGAVVSLTQVLAMEWAPYQINVNSISPTVILTELGKKAWAGEVGEEMKKLIPLGRFGYPEEVAAAALYLVSDAASLITGENLMIDGGYTIK